MSKPRLFVMRARDLIQVHPDTDWSHNCSRCQEPVGIFPSGQSVLAAFGKDAVEIICSRCGDPGNEAQLAPGALSEITQTKRRH